MEKLTNRALVNPTPELQKFWFTKAPMISFEWHPYLLHNTTEKKQKKLQSQKYESEIYQVKTDSIIPEV